MIKYISAKKAVEPIGSGQRIFVGSGAGEPQHLVEALYKRGKKLSDTEVLHLMTLGSAPYAKAGLRNGLRHNALFIGANVRSAVKSGIADYSPCFLSEVPELFKNKRLALDAALIQVSPPRGGYCSLGIAVDVVKAAVKSAPYVVAQVNPRMPWTCGASRIRVNAVNVFVKKEEPLCELSISEPTAASLWIGKYVATLIEDGATLQLGIGSIPDAVLASLGGKKDLGVHTEMISDGILALIEKGVVNGRRKTLHPRKIVTSFCLGTKKLYEAVARNPMFEFRPTEYVNDPGVIAKNDRMVSVNSALQVDLTGQVAADSIGHSFYSGVGGQVDFVRGATRSKGGRSIIALPATAKGGSVSRIVPCLSPGTGVVTSRADIDFVVTEFGIASLKGKTIRERAIALIQIAHPIFRAEMIQEAKRIGYLDSEHVLPVGESRYDVGLEAHRVFKDVSVFFRPIKPTDERKLKELFYAQSPETTQLRFGIPLKKLSEQQFQKLVSIDYDNTLAIGAFVREAGRECLVGIARYYARPEGKFAEAAFTVLDRYQGLGIGSFLVEYLSWIAEERGLIGFVAEVLDINSKMKKALERTFGRLEVRHEGSTVLFKGLFAHRKRKDNPALREQDVEACVA
jgi:acyl-CoA hydrolase/GNAT superfamily N-acetyltransferase